MGLKPHTYMLCFLATVYLLLLNMWLRDEVSL